MYFFALDFYTMYCENFDFKLQTLQIVHLPNNVRISASMRKSSHGHIAKIFIVGFDFCPFIVATGIATLRWSTTAMKQSHRTLSHNIHKLPDNWEHFLVAKLNRVFWPLEFACIAASYYRKLNLSLPTYKFVLRGTDFYSCLLRNCFLLSASSFVLEKTAFQMTLLLRSLPSTHNVANWSTWTLLQ